MSTITYNQEWYNQDYKVDKNLVHINWCNINKYRPQWCYEHKRL